MQSSSGLGLVLPGLLARAFRVLTVDSRNDVIGDGADSRDVVGVLLVLAGSWRLAGYLVL